MKTVENMMRKAVWAIAALVVLGIVVVLVEVVSGATDGVFARVERDFRSAFLVNDGGMVMLKGFGTTVLVSLSALVFGTGLGAALCFWARSQKWWVRVPARIYVNFVQGLPALIVLMMLTYWVFRRIPANQMWVTVLGFSLHFSANACDAMCIGLASVGVGQIESARALGMDEWQIFRQVTVPQAGKAALRAYRPRAVTLVRGTSVLGYFSLRDLIYSSHLVIQHSTNPMYAIMAAATMYFLLTGLVSVGVRALEARFDPKRRKRVVKGVVMQ